MSSNWTTSPPFVKDVLITLPRPYILLVTLNRPKQLNALYEELHHQLESLWTWFDDEPSLRCAVVTGVGRAFCAGADLKAWNQTHAATAQEGKKHNAGTKPPAPRSGFGGLSNRRGKKPVIAAVNGICMGGGMEMVLNVDMVIAAEDAKFALPEVTRGVVPIQGALPRLIRSVGMQRASEMALLGRTYSAEEMLRWGLVNHIVRRGEAVLETALQWAGQVASSSPDSIIVAREGLLGGWDPESPRASTDRILMGLYRKMDGADNMKEGVVSFVEKRKPVWKDSKL